MHHAAYTFSARTFFANGLHAWTLRTKAPRTRPPATTGPGKALTATAAVALWLGGAAPALSQQPSFDCAASHAPDELAICSNFALAQLDRQLSDMYAAARERLDASRQAELKDSQRAWLRERSVCGRDVKCITRLYQQRIPEVSALAVPAPPETEPIQGAHSEQGEEIQQQPGPRQ